MRPVRHWRFADQCYSSGQVSLASREQREAAFTVACEPERLLVELEYLKMFLANGVVGNPTNCAIVTSLLTNCWKRFPNLVGVYRPVVFGSATGATIVECLSALTPADLLPMPTILQLLVVADAPLSTSLYHLYALGVPLSAGGHCSRDSRVVLVSAMCQSATLPCV
jgi:hypothetical protein